MSVQNAAGTTLTEAQVNALTDAAPAEEALVTITADVYQSYSYTADSGGFERGKRLLWHEGQVVPQREIDALFLDATLDTVTPATGPAAGGTDITVTGTNFSGASGATLGGVAVTMFKVVSNTVITCRTGAHAAGVVSLVLADDAGSVTKTTAFTYV